MTRNGYIGYFGAAFIVVSIGALVARYATLWIARFKPRYSKTLISSAVAFIATVAVVTLLQFYAPEIHSSSALRALVAFIVLACCHKYFLRSEGGDQLLAGKACIVALIQMVGAVVGLLVVLLILAGTKWLLT
jgi:hypothetical protein